MSPGKSSLAAALALAFAHGPLAGTAPALLTERDGPTFRVRASWSFLGASVALEARATTLDACHDTMAGLVLRLWPELEEAPSGCKGGAGARSMTLRPVPVEQARQLAAQAGGRLLAVIVVGGDGFAITTWGRTRAECRGLRRWSEREGDDVVTRITAWAALER